MICMIYYEIDIDDLSDLLCSNIYQELDKFYKKFAVRKPTRKRYRKNKTLLGLRIQRIMAEYVFC